MSLWLAFSDNIFLTSEKNVINICIYIASFEPQVPLKLRCKASEGQGKKKLFVREHLDGNIVKQRTPCAWNIFNENIKSRRKVAFMVPVSAY